jgi:hypothetical protein
LCGGERKQWYGREEWEAWNWNRDWKRELRKVLKVGQTKSSVEEERDYNQMTERHREKWERNWESSSRMTKSNESRTREEAEEWEREMSADIVEQQKIETERERERGATGEWEREVGVEL